jgi:hypothetical protein
MRESLGSEERRLLGDDDILLPFRRPAAALDAMGFQPRRPSTFYSVPILLTDRL